MPLPEIAILPPPTVKSPTTRSLVGASDRVTVMVAVSLVLSVAAISVRAKTAEGAAVSTVIGVPRLPAELLLPAASVKAPAAKDMVPLVVLLASGVKVRV